MNEDVYENPDRELHELFGGRLKLYQQKKGYRFSIDSVLLGNFASCRACGSVVDLGTGSGVLPLILSRRKRCCRIVGMEIQKELVQLARDTIALNGLADSVTIIHADVRQIHRHLDRESWDAVVANPPFYRAGSGRVNPVRQSAVARHELFGALNDFVAAARYLLKNGGRWYSIFPAARIADIITALRGGGIEPKTLRMVHARMEEPADVVLIEGVRGGGPEARVLSPMILYSGSEYTDEVRSLFQSI